MPPTPHPGLAGRVIVPSGRGWLATCTPCDWEAYFPRRPAADKAHHEHLKTNHKENN